MVIVFQSSGYAATEDDMDYPCGKPTPIDGYKVTFNDDLILLPSYVILQRKGHVLFADPNATVWNPPYTSAGYATITDLLLILTEYNDCIDIDVKRLFIIGKDINIIHQPLWTSHWEDGFFIEKGKLTYWSEWFCYPENKDKGSGKSYVYEFSKEKESFVRVDIAEAKYCENPPIERFIKFKSLEPMSKK